MTADVVHLIMDFDPMDGSMGADFVAAASLDRETAQAEVDRRNANWHADWQRSPAFKANGDDAWWHWKHAKLATIRLLDRSSGSSRLTR